MHRRPIWVCALVAACAVYLPATLPLFGVGPLMECPHCIRIYLWWFPAAPFAAPASLLRVGDWGWVVGAIILGVAWLGGMALLTRRAPWYWIAIGCAASALASVASSLGFAGLLRM